MVLNSELVSQFCLKLQIKRSIFKFYFIVIRKSQLVLVQSGVSFQEHILMLVADEALTNSVLAKLNVCQAATSQAGGHIKSGHAGDLSRQEMMLGFSIILTRTDEALFTLNISAYTTSTYLFHT